MATSGSQEPEIDERLFYDQVLHRQTLGHRLRVLSMLQSRILNHRLATLEVTRMHWVVLSCLWQVDGLPVSQISQLLSQVGGSTSEVLDRMEERKLVKRRRARSDRRVCRVFLTPKGEELFARLPALALPVTEKLFSGFEEHEKVFLSAGVDRIAANLKRLYCAKECGPAINLTGGSGCTDKIVIDQKIREILPPYSFGYRLKVCYQLITRRFNDLCAVHDINTAQWHILRCLWAEDGLPVSAVGEMVDQVGGNLTALLKRLEARGLVLRKQESADRRCFRVWLGPKAQELFEPTMAVAWQVMKEAFAGISLAEQEKLLQLTERCITNLSGEQKAQDACTGEESCEN